MRRLLSASCVIRSAISWSSPATKNPVSPSWIIAFLDGGSAWLGWQNYGLDVIAADQKSDGSTFYIPQMYPDAGHTR